MSKWFAALLGVVLLSGCLKLIGMGEKPEPSNETIYCISTRNCPNGMGCYRFPGEEGNICWEGDPCVRCSSGACIVAESDPMQVFCK